MWCLVTVVLANAYGGVLFSFLSVTKLEQPINSLEELANSKDVKLIAQLRFELTERFLVLNDFLFFVITKHDVVFFMWQNAANGSEKLIGDSLRANPDNLITSLKDLDKRMMTGCCAFTFVNNFLKFNICS